ncbi:MAG: alpha/beta hydrolase [Planctomycetes bacterium]|nr:alpha/beta hydrolase [Planctomycetota bacterium]
MAASRFLLVHGAWHGAWSFDLLRLELERRAVGCEAIDLPGLGDEPTDPAEATFELGVERLLERLGTRRNWTLVAHSFGAFAATEAALRASGRVRALVIIAGFVAQVGDDWAAVTAVAPVEPGFRACQRRNAAGTALELDAKAASFLWHDMAPGIAAAAQARVRPQPIEPFRSAKIGGTAEALRKIPRSLLLATQDRVLPPAGLRALAERAGVAVEELATGHCPFLSAPKLVADRLLGVK